MSPDLFRFSQPSPGKNGENLFLSRNQKIEKHFLIHFPIIFYLVSFMILRAVKASLPLPITPIQEPSIFDFDGDNGLDLLIFVRITFPEIFSVLNGREQKAYRILNPQKS